MKPQSVVKKTTLQIAMGTIALSLVMILIYALLGQFSWKVPVSAALGSAWAVCSFFLLGITVQKAAKDSARAKNLMQFSYSLRMLVSAVVMIVGFTVPVFEPIAVAAPLLFPRLTILGMQMTGYYKPEPQAEGGEE